MTNDMSSPEPGSRGDQHAGAVLLPDADLLARIGELTANNNSLTGQINELTGKYNDLVGRHNELTGRHNDLTGRHNELTGRFIEVAGGAVNKVRVKTLQSEVRTLSEVASDLTGKVNSLTGENNALTGKNNKLTGQVNELTGLNNSLTARVAELNSMLQDADGADATNQEKNVLAVNVLTAMVNDLTGRNNELTDKNNKLTGRVNELTGLLTQALEEKGAAAEDTPPVPTVAKTDDQDNGTGFWARLIRRAGKLSNTAIREMAMARDIAGLQLKRAQMLKRINQLTKQNSDLAGQLTGTLARANDLVVEREAIVAQIANGDLNVPSLQSSNEVSSEISAKSAVRQNRKSKFLIVSNHRCGSTWLQTMLGSLPDTVTDFEIKWDIPYQPRPLHKVLRNDSDPVSLMLEELPGTEPVAGSKLVLDPIAYSKRQLRQMSEKLGDDVVVVHLVRNYQEIVLSRVRGTFHQLNTSRSHDVGQNLLTELQESSAAAASARPIKSELAVADLYEELSAYLMNDVHLAHSLGHGRYLRVGYDEVNTRFSDIVRFIGSEATPPDIVYALANAPTEKLPTVPPEDLLSNLSELQDMFDQFEMLKQQVISNIHAAGDVQT